MPSREPLAAIFGCAGPSLGADEARFFRDADPVGFILFRRNCETPEQIRALVAALRDTVGRADAPVLIDQEGGRVARLQPPHWPSYPAAATIAALGGAAAQEAAGLAARLIADDVAALGITVDCTPVLDLPVPGADPIIGSRAWGSDPASVVELGRIVCGGMLAGGVLPVIKHIPGHGRAAVDTHLALPRVDTPRAELEATDFAPFRALAGMPWAMTAHVLFSAIDDRHAATVSPVVIAEIIRGSIGFDGLLVSDDLSMQALGGTLGERAAAALTAGCDIALHCNGTVAEMIAVAGSATPVSVNATRRLSAGEVRRGTPMSFDRAAATARLAALLQGSA